MIIGIIPARGGSVGIPRKNLRPVGEISLVNRAVLFGLDVCDLVAVTSDDEEIIATAVSTGAIGVKRPVEISTGTASSESAIAHALEFLTEETKLKKLFNSEPNPVVGFIQATSPFQERDAFTSGAALIQELGPEFSTFSAVEDYSFLWEQLPNETWSPRNHNKSHRTMRQDLSPTVKETGGFYQFRMQTFLKSGSRFSEQVVPLLVDPRYAIDIDTEQDLQWADFLAPTADPNLSFLTNKKEEKNAN
ncbi:N-acylneuraminate cytidylyltransferase [Candidatus Planktophila dulcis]|uniref:acylneuraminate cytidylyltransferase family protein n=1 Tax=Candidatus Planktophila dulcis TaxID=1884914 RepID=UPI000BAC8408|nr:acylneuraminate cytidylyltransferase family protein [Candidatus Planktophila dulcis]ASY14009.1 N-acylneuraminate cytidylyltransferase [Candidatus Planktophila dulcis]